MEVKNQKDDSRATDETLLEGDKRWELVQRIVASEGFQRASQLRSILKYTSQMAILRPDNIPGEFEIARNVLGRREDFNPANDNIVRAQFSHLRRKLEHYFETEGKAEPLVLTIPKGSYTPVFAPHQIRIHSPAVSEPSTNEPVVSAAEPAGPSPDRMQSARPKWWDGRFGVLLGFNLAVILLILLFLLVHNSSGPKEPTAQLADPFVQFLSRSEGDVTIVEPDTSLVMIEDIVGGAIPLSEYISKDFPQRQLASIKNPAMQNVISSLSKYRTTSANESLIAVDFYETLKRAGGHATIRYARDMHVSDLNEGNTVLIGGPNSDPWVTLFNDRFNFRHFDNIAEKKGYFENLHPEPGEQAEYLNTYANQSVGYVDIALTQNLSQSGYVLLINGADMQANEAAARFLLHGRLPTEISSLLNRKDLRYFELFLRSKHIAGEADSTFELVAFRIK
jgi:hypothetical protein